MAIYGYIEDGYLRAKEIKPIVRQSYNENGDVVTHTVTVDEQIAELSQEWKPVDEIDESKTISADVDYAIRLVPYDAGTHIAYRYEKVVNVANIKSEIDSIKAELADTDYQIIKCYEASLVGEELPYDINALHNERNEKRAQINTLETKLTNLTAL